MDNTKIKAVNEFKMLLFTVILGAVAGAVVWLFLKAVTITTGLFWETIPGRISLPFYPVILCGFGGLLLGIVHKLFGDYPEELKVVIGKIKKNKFYDYKPMAAILIAAFLPLVFGASVGPEAGLTGIIAGLCYWIGDNIKFAREDKEKYNEIGAAVTLGIIFHAPLFGIFSVEEERESDASDITIPKPAKMMLYASSMAAGMFAYWLLGRLFGKGMAGMPGFSSFIAGWLDYILILLYFPLGIILYLFYEICEKILGTASSKIPVIPRSIVGGLAIGAAGMFVPMVLFSGEEEIGVLAENFGMYAPAFLIGIALLKVILTAVSIKFGFKGGHFFPLIFACVSMGFGLAMLFFAKDVGGHAAFAAGMVTATTLGAQLKKPMAVSMLLLLVFPVKMLLFIFVTAAVAGRVSAIIEKRKQTENG